MVEGQMLSSCWISICRNSPLVWERLGTTLCCPLILYWMSKFHLRLISSNSISKIGLAWYKHYFFPLCSSEGFMLVYIEPGVWRLTTMLTLSTFPPRYLFSVFIPPTKSCKLWQDKIYILQHFILIWLKYFFCCKVS